MVGKVSTSKKSADLMCASRCSWPVSIEDRSISAVTVESSGFSPVTISPEKVRNRPRTLLTIMWRAAKPTSEWTGSMDQVPATYPGMPVRVPVSLVVMSSSCCQVIESSMIECSTGITSSVTLSSAQLFLVYTGGYGGNTVAYPTRTGRLAILHGRLPCAVHRGGRPAPAGRRDAAGLLRDPGTAVRGTRPRAADEPARRGGLGEQEPRLARGGPAGGARLGPAGGLPHRPARPGGRSDRRGLRGAGRHRPRPRRAGPRIAVRRARP